MRRRCVFVVAAVVFIPVIFVGSLSIAAWAFTPVDDVGFRSAPSRASQYHRRLASNVSRRRYPAYRRHRSARCARDISRIASVDARGGEVIARETWCRSAPTRYMAIEMGRSTHARIAGSRRTYVDMARRETTRDDRFEPCVEVSRVET